jgi:hypothetical protein
MARDHQPQGVSIAKPMLLLLLGEISEAWQTMNFSAVNGQNRPRFTKSCGAGWLAAISKDSQSLQDRGSDLGDWSHAPACLGCNKGGRCNGSNHDQRLTHKK